MRLKSCNPYFTKPSLSGNPFFQPPYALALLLCAWRLFRRFGVEECDFCMFYAPHANHSVIYYYEATALGSNYAVNDEEFHWVVVHEFEHHGWSVQDVYLGNPMRHDEKILAHQPRIFRQATLDALLQPPSTAKCCANENKVKLV